MKTLLLTWWLGYIGSNNAVLFLQEWYEVVILDNLSNSTIEVITNIEHISKKKITFYEWDLRNISDIEKVFLENNIDTVVHFAWAKAVWESCENPFYYYDNNIIWSLNVFKVMEKHSVKNVVFSSSANVYGPNGASPFSESDISWDTSNPYGTTKYIIERLLRDLSDHAWFNVISLRYFNPVWAHTSWFIGETANQRLGNILPFLLKVANNEQEYIEIYGNDYPTPDGTGVRDYIHIMDLAGWHLSALRYLEKNINWYEIINLWTGKWTSVLELITYVRKATSHPIPQKIVPRRDIDIATAYCSTQKAENLLWWKANKTVEDAVKDSWNFIKKQSS